MLFNSLNFLIFFPVVFLLYVNLPKSFRSLVLLLSSYFFYACWRIEYLPLIMFSTVVDYFVAIGIPDNSKRGKKALLSLSLISNFGLLFFFKYHNFFAREVNSVIDGLIPYHEFLLPVGISFYTFQTVSYTIDVYRGQLQPERNFIKFATFVSFFPQLVAGPIERASDLLSELNKDYVYDPHRFDTGLRLMLWGFFKKIVIADNLAKLVDIYYSQYESADYLSMLIGLTAFSFQIFCDFSGYSDIARGVARIFGINLMNNFNMPYLSGSIKEFWSRWHISLSTWFRDYVYIPLGGGRVSSILVYRNLFITFFISGIWHGANWTFMVWGTFHAVLLMIEKFLSTRLKPIESYWLQKLKILFTFILVTIGWIYFRSQNISQANLILLNFFGLNFDGTRSFLFADFKTALLLALGFLIVKIIIQLLREHNKLFHFNKLPRFVQYLSYLATMVIILLFGSIDSKEFIYFDF